jgi:hypothetical protein
MFRPKLRYAHQGGMNPPVIVIHGNSLEHVTDAYKRFLEGRFRKEFDLVGTPLRIEMKPRTTLTPTKTAAGDVRQPLSGHRLFRRLPYPRAVVRCATPTTLEHGEYREQ